MHGGHREARGGPEGACLTIRLTAHERAQLEAQARALGMTVEALAAAAVAEGLRELADQALAVPAAGQAH